MRHTLILLLSLFSLSKVEAQSLNFVWTAYDTSSKIDVKSFSTLTEIENRFAKSFEGFLENRARLTLMNNGKVISPKEFKGSVMSLPCECILRKDTVQITAALGFFAGAGIITAVHKDQFAATYFAEADGTDVFKSRESDTAYADRISVAADEEKLTLYTKPAFVDNETIIGTVEGQFKPFYELNVGAEPPVKSVIQAKLFFRCKVHAWKD